MSTGLGPAVCPPGWLWEDFFCGRLAQLTKQLSSQGGQGQHAAVSCGPCWLHALSPAEWEPRGAWRGPCAVNPGAPVSGTPMFMTGLLGTVCWLGRP